ncbi:uncharacterized protein LOC119066987 [Bradysia coprophila]|uniref:uncharacterized protein LOC119066987 n=1 Tax=Bradysia coprophila TaxID=38358 RepID=UPI00187D87CE|nr:uncharacterized protein LOC119066987 [Bradysia coprophila]
MNSISALLESAVESVDLKDFRFGNVKSKDNDECHVVQNCDVDRSCFIDKIMNHYLRHNLSLICLEDLMKLLNDNRETCDRFPTSKDTILKMFGEQRDLFHMFNFIKCEKCHCMNKVCSDVTISSCARCNTVLKTTETNFFVVIPIEQQIRKSVKDNWSHICEFEASYNKNNQSYSDARDGKILKDINEQYAESDINILSLCLNLDGANKYKSNTLSVWPIQLIQNYLPPNIRFLPHNIIVSGLYYHQKKPDCYEYMLPLINELNELSQRKITLNIGGEEFVFKPIITHCSVDLPAKSLLQATKQFGGYESCTYCDIVGELIVLTNSNRCNDGKTGKKKKNIKENTNKPKKPKKFVRYTERDEPCALRDEVQTLQTMLAVSTSTAGESINGVKDVSCLVSLEHFNIIFSIGVEYMHAVLLGVTKRCLNYFCNPNNNSKTYYIPPKSRALLNARLLAIKPTSNITRKPRSLDQRKNFKASEFRSLLLYYLPVCLPGLVSNEYVHHIRILSAAVYKLLKADIPYKEVDQAENYLLQFVKDHQQLFGKENMVMVIHLLKHLSNSVRQLGPLWCHSAFSFERNNGCLLKLVNGTTDVLDQMSSKYTLSKSVPRIFKQKKFCRGKPVIIVETHLELQCIESLERFDLSNKSISAFKRIKLDNVIYTSLLYTRPKKTIDYFIGLKDGVSIGMVKFYFELNHKMCVLIEQFEVVDYIYHIEKVIKSNKLILAPVENIAKKFIFMKVGLNQYIVTPPNPYENE